RKSACPLRDRVLVIAAVSVVLPWSMCPIVPTFTCGLLRSNFFLAMSFSSSLRHRGLSPPRGSNPRPRPYQGRALPTELGGRSRALGHIKEVALRNHLRASNAVDYRV